MNIDIESIKLKIRNSFAGIRFVKDTHQYVYNSYILESSSSYRKEFENGFETYFSAESKYKANVKINPDTKRTAAYYRERWDLLGQEARIRGTRVHLFSETYPDFDEPSCDKERGVVEFFEKLDPKYVLIFQELIMFDSEYYKAGTADLIFLNTETGNIVIGDWKTNDKSIFENYKGKKLKGNFAGYIDTSYNKYSMQLSHYQYMLEKATELVVEDRWLIWLATSSCKKDTSIPKNKDYKYQKVDAIGKGKFHRVYSCRNLTDKISKSFAERKESIISNLQQVPLTSGNLNAQALTSPLTSLKSKLPKLPTLKLTAFNKAGKMEYIKGKMDEEKSARKKRDIDSQFD